MTVAPPHPFDADTGLEPAGDGRWRAHTPAHWFVGRGPNGGFLAALVARAAEAASGRPLRSLTLHFLAAPEEGPLAVTAVVQRQGRRHSGLALRIEQGGRPVTLALATLGELPDEGAEWDATTMPSALPLEQTERVPPDKAGVPEFMRNYDLRWALGTNTAHAGETYETGGWMRTAEPRALDGPLAAALTDAWAPASFVALGRIAGAPTVDLTIHVRRQLPPADMAPDDYVLGRFTTRLAVSGTWEEDGELWTPGGELIVQSRQLALVREPRP